MAPRNEVGELSESALLLTALLADEPPYVADRGDEVAADLEELWREGRHCAL
ncbi:hypothetical protein [Nocardioides baculatus]|uniref:Uncharacterized protein n=1 Tax=Nocardioides baculatus TaxID=2801337 RepID=A0ABS1LA27_9ACTN|nr:hypothetical protein [Nocardioides baculatus]MBL0748490.1 hypothetical protein [Nocardioides baculatus]